MNLKNCYNFEDFRKLAKKNLPAPIFHYIDGGSDDEVTLKRNTDYLSKYDSKTRKKIMGTNTQIFYNL